MARRGTFIVLEGTDGSGKGTQFSLLRDRLTDAGYRVATFDFPQYSQPSSYFVTQYLNGAYGSAEAIGPYTASLFYALDRYETASRIRDALDAGTIVLANRFTGSSMGHQGAKFANAEERRGYFIWLDNLEFEMLRIPRPDVSFVLRVPAEVAETLIDKKAPRSYTDKKRDIHEADPQHLQRSVAVYDDLCQLFPKDFKRIDCVRGGKLLDIEAVQHLLWEKISPLLPPPAQLEMPMPSTNQPIAATTPATSEPADVKLPSTAQDSGEPAKPVADHAYITSKDGAVYAFTNELSPAQTAAVMATLSRSSGALSTTVLKAFASAAQKDNTFLRRVLDTYGSESIRRLVSQQVVVTGASALLAQKLHSNPVITCTRPRADYIRAEQKTVSGAYKYYVPTALDNTTASQYAQRMDSIFSHYSAMLPRMVAYLQDQSMVPQQNRTGEWKAAIENQARALLQGAVPMACTATVGLYGAAVAFDELIVHLRADGLPEAQQTGESILHELYKTIPEFMADTDQSERGSAATMYHAATRQAVAVFTKENIPETYAPQTTAVQLTDVWPRNEFDLVPDMLYSHTNLPLSTIRQAVAGWPYERKLHAMDAYLGERLNRQSLPGEALEKAAYSWDVISSLSTFRELQESHLAAAPDWQLLTPRAGYEVPGVIDDAGCADLYEACFDISLSLHSLLQQAGYTMEAQYATLAGHRLRWKIACTARQAMRFFEQHSNAHVSPETRQLIETMHERVLEVHPILGNAIDVYSR